MSTVHRGGRERERGRRWGNLVKNACTGGQVRTPVPRSFDCRRQNDCSDTSSTVGANIHDLNHYCALKGSNSNKWEFIELTGTAVPGSNNNLDFGVILCPLENQVEMNYSPSCRISTDLGYCWPTSVNYKIDDSRDKNLRVARKSLSLKWTTLPEIKLENDDAFRVNFTFAPNHWAFIKNNANGWTWYCESL